MSTHQHSLARGTRIRVQTRRFGKLRVALTTILVVAALVLAGTAINPQNTSLTHLDDSSIGEFEPVGAPNWGALMPYELPELRPSVHVQLAAGHLRSSPTAIGAAQRAGTTESVDSARITGPR